MNNRSIIELGILVPLATIFVFVGVYFYELGFFLELKMPKELIQVELTKNIFLVFYFVPALVFLLSSVESYRDVYKWFMNAKNKWRKFLTITFFLVLILGVLYSKYKLFSKTSDGTWLFFNLLLSLFIGIVLFLVSNRKKVSDTTSEVDVTLNNVTAYDFMSDVSFGLAGPVIIVFSIICLVAFQIGSDEASKINYEKVFCKSDKKTILLKRYSDYTIYGVRDSTGKPFNQFIVSPKANTDTLIFTK